MQKFPLPVEECVDLHGTFTLVSVRYTSVGSSAGWVMAVQVSWVRAVQVGWVRAVQVRSAVVSQGSG